MPSELFGLFPMVNIFFAKPFLSLRQNLGLIGRKANLFTDFTVHGIRFMNKDFSVVTRRIYVWECCKLILQILRIFFRKVLWCDFIMRSTILMKFQSLCLCKMFIKNNLNQFEYCGFNYELLSLQVPNLVYLCIFVVKQISVSCYPITC